MVVIQLGDTEPTAVLGERKGRRNEGLTHGGGGRVEGSVQWREYSQGWGGGSEKEVTGVLSPRGEIGKLRGVPKPRGKGT